MVRFTAKMEHDAGTIGKLVDTQQRTFQFGRRAAQFGLAVVLILYGLYAEKTMITPYFALFGGCLLLTLPNVMTKSQTKRILEQMNGDFPSSDYTFTDEGFTFYKQGELIRYSKLMRLIEDPGYLYLYVSKQSAYMVDKSAVSGGADELKAFLKEKTGLSWGRPNSLLTFSFLTVLRNRKEAQKKEYKGPRLK